MLRSEIARYLREFLDDSAFGELLKSLMAIAPLIEPIREHMESAVRSIGNDNEVAGQLRHVGNALAQARQDIIEKLPPIEAFLLFEHLDSSWQLLLIRMYGVLPQLSEPLSVRKGGVEVVLEFDVVRFNKAAELYNRFISSHSNLDTYRLLEYLNKLSLWLELLITVLPQLATVLSKPSTAALTLRFDRKQTVKDFAEKCDALHELYEGVCVLIGVDDEPLTIVNADVGSVELGVEGNTSALLIVSWLVVEVVRWLFDNYSKEGRIRRDSVAIVTVAEVRDKLKASGIDVDKADQELSGAFLGLTKNARRLVEGEAKVTVNDKEMEVPFPNQQQYIEEARTLRIEDKRDEQQQPPIEPDYTTAPK